MTNHRVVDAVTEARLRLLDLAMTAIALPLLALPLLVALAVGRPVRLHRTGLAGRPYRQHHIDLPAHALGRALERLGAARWTELFDVLSGEMSWIGPAPRVVTGVTGVTETPLTVRPGLFNSWYVRRRTAVDFDGEALADADDLAMRGVRRHLGLVGRALLVSLLPAPDDARAARLTVGDLTIDNLDTPGALARIDELMCHGRGAMVCFVNPACVNIAARHRGYRRALGRAALVLPDGIGVKMAGDLLGTPLKQNVNGTDLFPRLLDLLDRRRARIFLLGGRPGVPEAVAKAIRQQWPRVEIAGVRDGYFAAAEEGRVVEAIRTSGAEVLLVARGVPSQEIFVDRHGPLLGVKVAIGVGGLFDFVSGRIPRAPRWMREIGTEWVYRLLQEPGRMWRRYLLGNFSFLARVAMQRLGLRSVAADPLPQAPGATPPAAPHQTAAATRAILFATPAAHSDIPVPRETPAALLPVGPCTLVERHLEQLALAGVRQIDIVVCEAPERLRALLGHGERWGVTLAWHTVKEPSRPYAVLRLPALQACGRVVLAHTDALVDDATVRRLVAADGVALHEDERGHRHWTGWASGSPHGFAELPLQSDRADLRWSVLRAPVSRLELGLEQCVTRLDAQGLLRAQSLAATTAAGAGVPRSWIQAPWGAHSPQAYVHPGARIDGPVLVGHGCVVHDGARLGPHTWLGQNVVVAAGTQLRDALVLAETYVGGALDVEQAIVNGRRVRSLRHSVETVVAAADGVLGWVRPERRVRPGWVGRTVAATLLGVTVPVLGTAALAWRLRAGSWPWMRERVVIGRHPDADTLAFEHLIACRGDTHGLRRLLAGWAGMADIVRGRRAWFGVRPRRASQWYALSAEWQRCLSAVPVGLLHEPAWFAAEAQRMDAEAAADVFYAARAGWREHLRLIGVTLRARWRGSGADDQPLSIQRSGSHS